MHTQRTFRTLTIAATVVMGMALAGCGDDDSSSSAEPTRDSPSNSEDDANSDHDAGNDVDGAADDAGAPYPLLATSLHADIDLPGPGAATVTVGPVTYHFDSLDQCGIDEVDEGRGERFQAAGETSDDDGRVVRFTMFRSVNTSGSPAAGASFETDAINVFVQQELGEQLESNAYLRGDRMEDGGGVQGADSLPFVLVTDDGGSLAATGVGEIDHLSSDVPDAAPTGPARVAVNCG